MDYDSTCENRRLMEISRDIGHRPVVFIRFNPDDYIDKNGTKIRSCFTTDKNGILKVAKTKQAEWNERIGELKSQIEYWSGGETKSGSETKSGGETKSCGEIKIEKTVEVVSLFFDSY